jgi:hypothetical protein
VNIPSDYQGFLSVTLPKGTRVYIDEKTYFEAGKEVKIDIQVPVEKYPTNNVDARN